MNDLVCKGCGCANGHHDECTIENYSPALELQQAQAELASYKAGFEVEGEIDHNGHNSLFVSSILVQQSYCGIDEFEQGQRVRVLVIPEERIVGSNKTIRERDNQGWRLL